MNKGTMNSKKTQTMLIYVVAAVSLVLLTVIIAVGSAANRTVGRGEESEERPPIGTDAPVDTSDSGNENPESAVPPNESGSEIESGSGDESSKDTASEDVNNPVVDELPDFTSPISGTVSKEHSGDVLVYSMTMNDYRIHTGIDISASVGEGVRAVADGVIGEIWQEPMMGWCISVIHSGEAVSIYRNLSEDLPSSIKKGAAVKGGEIIAAVGESALIESADEAHLHFELTIGEKSVDPLDYFSQTASAEPKYEG